MSDGVLALLGGVSGLVLAYLANLFLLPRLLASQQKVYAEGRGGKSVLKDVESAHAMTRFIYRKIMPAVFALVMSVLFIVWFGGSQ